MALTGAAYPFGLRECVVTPITDPVLETLGTPIKLPASRVFEFGESESYVELRGDDRLVLSRGSGPTVDWTLEAGGLDLAIYYAMFGGQLANTGVTPNQVRSVTKRVTDSRPYFRIEGRSINDNGGDVRVTVFRCRATGDVEGNFSDSTFYLTNAEGQGFGSLAVATLDQLYRIDQNETPDPII